MDTANKKTLIIGASGNPQRYSYLAMNRLRKHGYDVVGIGKKKVNIAGVDVETEQKKIENIDTVSLYLNPANQKEYYDYIISLHPKRIIFNPGTENDELANLAKANGINTMEACTLVLLSTGQY